MVFTKRLGVRAMGWAVLLWMIGFVWGSTVFAIPQLKDLPSVAYLSKYPAISGVLLVVYVPLVIFVRRRMIPVATMNQRLKLGMILGGSNFILDAAVYFLILHSSDYFQFLSVWVSYALLLIVPTLPNRQTA